MHMALFNSKCWRVTFLTDIGLTFPSLFSIILSLQHLSLYYGLTFSNCLPFPWSRYCFPPTSHIFHMHLTFSTYTSYFPPTSHIFHKCLTFSTYISHYPQMLPIFHKCLHFSHILHIFHQHLCPFFFFLFPCALYCGLVMFIYWCQSSGN